MQRSELSGLVLQLKALGVDNIMSFEWLAPPPAEAMVRALEALHALGALGEDARLTQVGAAGHVSDAVCIWQRDGCNSVCGLRCSACTALQAHWQAAAVLCAHLRSSLR